MTGWWRSPSSPTYSSWKRGGRLKWNARVEGAFALDGFVGDVLALEGAFERGDGLEPVLVAAGVFGAVGGVPYGELDLELLKSIGVEHELGKVDTASGFVFDLIDGAEDVGVVLGK